VEIQMYMALKPYVTARINDFSDSMAESSGNLANTNNSTNFGHIKCYVTGKTCIPAKTRRKCTIKSDVSALVTTNLIRLKLFPWRATQLENRDLLK